MPSGITALGIPESPGDAELIYLNGIDPETGTYAIQPVSIDDLAQGIRRHPGDTAVTDLQAGARRGAPPFGTDQTNLAEVGWGIVFPESASQEIRDAFAPLIALRRDQAGDLMQTLDYRQGEQVRDWYARHQVAAGTFDAASVPYYLLLVGPPTAIPFDFQYLLGVEYAVGRIAFETPDEYARYAASIVDYETATTISNSREIVYWGTRHDGDRATNLSASLLVEPLANGIPGAKGPLKDPVHTRVGYSRRLYVEDDAVRAALLDTLCSEKPPAFLFTASHGMSIKSGRPNQISDNGGLLCQDWPGFGSVKRDHYLTAADIPDDANLAGTVAFLFACFGGGTPDCDQFLMDLSKAGTTPPLAPEPFVAALPRRMLAHPRGSRLAVIAHVDRAWGFSIQPARMTGAQIGPFREGLCYLLDGTPVGHVVSQQFGQKFAALSTALLGALAPGAPEARRLSDRDLVTLWLERNDSQNYVVLGDPAVHIRADLLS